MMELEQLDKTLEVLRKHKVVEYKNQEIYLKLAEDFSDTLTPEVMEAIEKARAAEEVSDEEVLFDPYAGLEVDDNG